MMNLMEIMQAAQGGQAMQNLSRQFGVTPEQAQAAVAAVLPAMSMGLRRQADSVDQFSSFLNALAQGRHGEAFETKDLDGDGIPDHLQRQGNDALAMLFGSKDVSRAVAGQAAQFAGLSDSLIRQMLPVIASMVMGGLMKSMNNQGFGGLLSQIANSFGAGGQGGQGSLADILGRMMTGGAMGGVPGSGTLGGAQPAPNPQTPNNPFGNIFGDVLGSMLGGGAAPSPAPRERQPAPPPAGGPPAGDPLGGALQAGLDALQEMFKTGAQVQKSQMDGLSQIFGQMMGGGAQRRQD